MTSAQREHVGALVYHDPHQILPCIPVLTLEEEKVLSPYMVYQLLEGRV